MQFELSYRGLRAAVDSHGGELVSLRDPAGTEYIWNGDPAFWPGRNPLLFPIVGNLKGGQVLFNGQPYEMSRHGFARGLDFSPVEQDANRVVLELRESPATLVRYPFPFSLRVCHALTEAGFSTAFRVENTGDAPMPFCIGAHTAFRCPLHSGERFEDYEIVFDQPETADMILLTPEGLVRHDGREPLLRDEDRFSLDRAVFDRLDTIILEGLRSTGVSLLHRETGHGVRLDFTGFPMVAFWTKSGCEAPFVCLEPWHGCAAADNEDGEFFHKPHCITLAPGEIRDLCYTITLM
ncbi:aldose 1-epimerase family protein [Dysosmobacter sp.]|uniref:aldose 1-epimerase family protein n=1 Tax=Dysosmobacter sp. TaxID=2591382 RepID=UPI002A922FFA|nr:aldose 1-epimerase family protein [Dysosmobacter sp.]MDY5612538.1 aldose 1-epimerase family protein [Dysosmobacter sp.]